MWRAVNRENTLTDFTSLGLAEPITRALTQEGYSAPTPIQAAAIPELLAGRDLLGTAQTGTGKTAAFTLPLLQRIVTTAGAPERKTVRALVLVPTRELASQVAENLRAYGRHVRHRAGVVVGGVRPGPQIRALAGGPDILIATPGRLEDHLRTGALRLDATQTVVLDEADQMLDLGFVPAIRRILGKLPRERQTVLLSATMPKQIRALAKDFLRNPAEVAVAPVSRPIEQISQSVIELDRAAKRDVLGALLAAPDVERAIVFTRTKRGADRVARHLSGAGLTADAIHGNKSQNQRERALAAFKSGRTGILVATDIAARGIDIDDVSHVVNFELPNVPETYVHRIGRTARAGKAGTAISLCEPDERSLLRDIEKLIGKRVPRADHEFPMTSSQPAEAAPEERTARPARPARRRAPEKADAAAEPTKKPRRRRNRGGKPKPEGGTDAPRRGGRRGPRGGAGTATADEAGRGLARMLGKTAP